MLFPQYRKYKNNQSFFKVISETRFIEFKREVGGFKPYEFEARILPDRNYINDMLEQPEPYWDVITEEEFTAQLGEV